MNISKRVAGLAVIAVLVSGCSSLAAQAANTSFVQAGDPVRVQLVSTTTNVALRDSDQSRVAAKISEHITQADNAAAPRYRVEVAITSYDKGNTYIRAMLNGLGEVHTGLSVRIFELPANAEVRAFTIAKTFAPDTVEGSVSRIQDIEDALAESVANAVLGRADGSIDIMVSSQGRTRNAS